MKKVIVAISVLLTPIVVLANDVDPKISTIEDVYSSETPNYQDYATQDLKDLLETASQADEMCIDYDHAIQSQDTVNFGVLGMQSIDDETVQVNITNDGDESIINYKMVCDDGTCLIDDIEDQQGSLRNTANECIQQQ